MTSPSRMSVFGFDLLVARVRDVAVLRSAAGSASARSRGSARSGSDRDARRRARASAVNSRRDAGFTTKLRSCAARGDAACAARPAARSSRPAQIPQHEDAERREHDRDELRRRQRVEDHAAIVAAIELDDEAQHARRGTQSSRTCGPGNGRAAFRAATARPG